jgi:hypothetical protein
VHNDGDNMQNLKICFATSFSAFTSWAALSLGIALHFSHPNGKKNLKHFIAS